jgi:hypothetical protein
MVQRIEAGLDAFSLPELAAACNALAALGVVPHRWVLRRLVAAADTLLENPGTLSMAAAGAVSGHDLGPVRINPCGLIPQPDDHALPLPASRVPLRLCPPPCTPRPRAP